MEEVIETYHLPNNHDEPVVCVDETSKQQTKEVRLPISCKPGQNAKYDSEYQRNGVSNLFMMFQPLGSWREVKLTNQRTAKDWGLLMKDLVDIHFATATIIHVVCDNLNTHNHASLYKIFNPEEARRIANKIQFHYTPKHGSWLNMAEIEFSVLSKQCLNRRIPDQETLKAEVSAWVKERNSTNSSINWQFTNEDARIKLRKLYPTI
jgi:transposase